MRVTTSSMVKSEVSSLNASSAAFKGETLRLESRTSRA